MRFVFVLRKNAEEFLDFSVMDSLIAEIASQKTLLNFFLWTLHKLDQGFLAQLRCSEAAIAQNFFFD